VTSGGLPSPLWLIATLIGTLVAMAALTVISERRETPLSLAD